MEIQNTIPGLMTAIPKLKFVEKIENGDNFDDIFIVDEIQSKTKKKGGVYFALVLSDRTGTIKAKMWDPQPEMPKAGDYVKVRAEASEYRDEIELTLKLVRKLDPNTETIRFEDFVAVGPRDRFKQMENFRELVDLIEHPGLRAACQVVFEDAGFHMAFRDAPAARGMHHPYVGGLLDHSLSMAKIAALMGLHYQHRAEGLPDDPTDGTVDIDLLVAAALFHDCGKIRELSWQNGIRYTREGNLVGHVVIGMEILDRIRPTFLEASCPEGTLPEQLDKAMRLWDHLRHIVASHHGQKEWGAAQTPMSREAQMFHIIDMMDSRMGAFDQVMKESTDDEGFTGWQKVTGGIAWKA